jgi:hypothetical protein
LDKGYLVKQKIAWLARVKKQRKRWGIAPAFLIAENWKNVYLNEGLGHFALDLLKTVLCHESSRESTFVDSLGGALLEYQRPDP